MSAVAVEIADSRHLPVQIRQRADEAFGNDRLAVSAHEIDVVLPVGLVAPQDVGLAVAVEIADPGHLPAHVGDRAQVALTGENRRAVERVDVVLSRAAGALVAPQDVGAHVAVEVALDGKHHAARAE